jgi:hypothetical protein
VIEDGLQQGTTEEQIDRVAVSTSYASIVGRPSRLLEVANVTLRPESFGDGLQVTGQATNTGTEAIESAHVGAIFFDDAGDIIGAATTNLLDDVAVGDTKAFETLGSNPLTQADVADYVVIGSSTF